MPVYYKALIKNGYELEPSPIRCGGEGSIFLVQGNSSIAAKVYSHGNAPKEKLYQMLKMPLAQKSDYIAWPQDILFNQTGTPAGFIMKRFSYTKSLAEMLSDTSFQWKKRICVAANLCDVVHEIHQVGQCIGDMNPSNFGVDTRNGHVCAFDADSFHLHDTHGQWYPCVVGIADYWPPELQRLTINGAELRCRFVKHIGQGRRREPLWEQPNEEDAWDGSCSDFGGQLAAHQSRRGNRNDACRRSAFGPLYDYVPPFRCAWAYRGG